MKREAHCQCGALRAEADGDPDGLVVCHCTACQRRSGSPFGAAYYYQRAQVRLTGEAREYVRTADSGNAFHSFFCPTCGTTLYWFSALVGDRVGIALGGFAENSAPPTRSVWETTKHEWVTFDDAIEGYIEGRTSARVR